MSPAQAGKPGSGLPRAKAEILPLRDSPGITCPAVLRGSGAEGWHSRHHPSAKILCPVPAARREGRRRWQHRGSPRTKPYPG